MDADRINRAIDHASESNRFILPLRETMRRTIRFRIASPAARAPFADRDACRRPLTNPRPRATHGAHSLRAARGKPRNERRRSNPRRTARAHPADPVDMKRQLYEECAERRQSFVSRARQWWRRAHCACAGRAIGTVKAARR
ncbi:hypothetical protein [Burkholderia pseudomallei]|uniref:hypothetical protein n=1 Tax=Burkholderia pseudomallei TaxID=28450 RepID=UPI001392424F|nr:hypothetical protein [Burkholderia pseudomallei]